MAELNVNYSVKILALLDEMPDFVSDFIYNFGKTNNYLTKYVYARDIRDFLQYMVNFMPEHAEKGIKDITLKDMDSVEPLDINRYLTLLMSDEKTGLKETTVKGRRAALSSMYGFLVNCGKLTKNPILATKPIDVPKKKLIYLTDEEQELLLDTVRSGDGLEGDVYKRHDNYALRDSAMFLLLLDTGLRVSEMLSTNISDFDLSDGSVTVIRKGGDVDIVRYSDECAECLEEFFISQRAKYGLEDAYIPAFTTTTGKRLGVRAVETLVKKYVNACMKDKVKLISPHKLRSSFAMSFYDESGKDILLLKKKMHHSSITTTNIYAQATDDDVKDTRNILQNRRRRKSTS